MTVGGGRGAILGPRWRLGRRDAGAGRERRGGRHKYECRGGGLRVCRDAVPVPHGVARGGHVRRGAYITGGATTQQEAGPKVCGSSSSDLAGELGLLRSRDAASVCSSWVSFKIAGHGTIVVLR